MNTCLLIHTYACALGVHMCTECVCCQRERERERGGERERECESESEPIAHAPSEEGESECAVYVCVFLPGQSIVSILFCAGVLS